MSKRTLLLMCSIFLIVPLLFLGCGSGDSGAVGATGATGAAGEGGSTGPPGPGIVSNESCVVCHGVGQAYDVAAMHSVTTNGLNVAGTATVTIRNLVFGVPVGDNVPVSVNFDFSATNDLGRPIDQSATGLNLEASSGNLPYTRIYLATLIPGTRSAFPGFPSSHEPDQWYDYANSSGNSRVAASLVRNSYNATTNVGNYTYTFLDNTVRISDGYLDNQVQRIGMQLSGLPITLFTMSDLTKSTPYKNATFDNVPAGVLSTTVTKNVVTKAACQNCHAPDQAIVHGSRYDPKFCVVCHNPTNPSADNPTTGAKAGQYNLGPFVHRIHTAQLIDNSVRSSTGQLSRDFREVAFPQDVRNCDTCHNDTQGDNWKNVPSIEACGSCHSGQGVNFDGTPIPGVDFATGAGHPGGPQANSSLCVICHTPALITGYHADPNTTPNNVTAGADNIVYFIDNVTVNGSNQPVVTFHITKNGSNLTIPADNTGKAIPPTGYTGTPGFLLAFAMPQDGVTTPADYTNFGNALTSSTGKNGQPESVNLTGLTLTGSAAAYTTTLTKAFPAGATMRAVALQSYWSQTIGGVSEGRHTPSVVKAVTGDAVRRTVVKSGYNATTGAPEGCLECHKKFEGHGGSRVNNVQVCVICHNPNMTSSGRTIDPAIAGGINADITALFGTDPLAYPEVPNNFKNLIHGIHSKDLRSASGGIEFVDIRNRLNGILVLGNEITFPGNLKHCLKCHIGTTYGAAQPANVLLTTTKSTTGVASETRAQIIAARNTVSNATDLVNSPTASACYGCHASIATASHMVQMGGDINSTRTGALMEIPWDLTLTP